MSDDSIRLAHGKWEAMQPSGREYLVNLSVPVDQIKPGKKGYRVALVPYSLIEALVAERIKRSRIEQLGATPAIEFLNKFDIL